MTFDRFKLNEIPGCQKKQDWRILKDCKDIPSQNCKDCPGPWPGLQGKWIDKMIFGWKNNSGRKNDSVRLKYFMLKTEMDITLTWSYQFSI